MLQRLYITNYALIDEVTIDFTAPFTVITGETGAGKSILLGALGLILGGKADAKSIRDPQRKTIVEATVRIAGNADADAWLDNNGLDNDHNECILRREIAPGGRSRAFVNDTPVALTALRELAAMLVDIHSQHSNLLLSSPQFQLSIIDNIAHNTGLRQQYAAAYQAYTDTQREIRLLTERVAAARTEQDYLRFQLDQLIALDVHQDEETELEATLQRLTHVNELKEQLWRVDSTLNAEEHSVIEGLKQVEASLQAAEQWMPDTQGMAQRVGEMLIDLKDIAHTAQSLQDTLALDPAEVERTEARMAAIYDIMRKHGVDNTEQLLARQADFQQRLSDIDSSDDRLDELHTLLKRQRAALDDVAAKLTESRRRAAAGFAGDLVKQARTLALNNLQFIVDITPVEPGPTGADAVAFLMAFNRNQQPMPVRDTASGGEISRLMLCLKAIVASHMQLPTLIFDEVDTGVSGDTASMMGEMMASIAQRIQVIAITHLPQVAAIAQQHLRVFKTDSATDRLTHVAELDDNEHLLEVARLLSGRDVNQAAIDNARSLISQNRLS